MCMCVLHVWMCNIPLFLTYWSLDCGVCIVSLTLPYPQSKGAKQYSRISYIVVFSRISRFCRKHKHTFTLIAHNFYGFVRAIKFNVYWCLSTTYVCVLIIMKIGGIPLYGFAENQSNRLQLSIEHIKHNNNRLTYTLLQRPQSQS